MSSKYKLHHDIIKQIKRNLAYLKKVNNRKCQQHLHFLIKRITKDFQMRRNSKKTEFAVLTAANLILDDMINNLKL